MPQKIVDRRNGSPSRQCSVSPVLDTPHVKGHVAQAALHVDILRAKVQKIFSHSEMRTKDTSRLPHTAAHGGNSMIGSAEKRRHGIKLGPLRAGIVKR